MARDWLASTGLLREMFVRWGLRHPAHRVALSRAYDLYRLSSLVLPRNDRPLLADTVAKVENRARLKISRKSIFSRPYCCKALQRRYEGPRSFLSETMWSLTSTRAKRISGPKKFRPSGEKDFFNTIGAKW
jgi:hypothetical protein